MVKHHSLYLALTSAFLAQLCFKLDLSVPVAILLYLLAAYSFATSVSPESVEQLLSGTSDTKHNLIHDLFFSPKKEAEIARIFLILLIAASFRLFRIDSLPGGIWIDESFTGVNALEIIEGKYAPLSGVTPLNRFRPEWVKTSNLYLYYVALILKLFGPTQFGLKMVSVIPGIAAIVGAYFLFKLMTPRPIAFLSALLMGVSHWNVITSRWGWDEVLMCFLEAIAYYFLFKGIDTKRKLFLILSGVTLGLCLYTYIASWIVLGIPLVYFAIKITLEPLTRRANLRHFFAVFLPCALIFLPLGLHFISQPGDFSIRLREVNIFQAVHKSHDSSPLWESTKKYALMFNYRGSADPRHNLANEPQLDFVTSIFFVFGLVFYLRYWNSSENQFLLIWFFLGLAAGFLTDPIDAPNAYRTAMINPVACLFAATALWQSLAMLYARFSTVSARKPIFVSTGVVLALYVATDNYLTYFVRRPASPASWGDDNLDSGIPKLIQNLNKNSENSSIYLDPLLLWETVLVNSWFLNYQPGKLFQPAYISTNIFHRMPASDSQKDTEIFYIAPPFMLPAIQGLFPESKYTVVYTPFGKPLYLVAKLRSRDQQQRLESASDNDLADVAYKLGSLYQRRSELLLPFGPIKNLLSQRASEEFTYAKQLGSGR